MLHQFIPSKGDKEDNKVRIRRYGIKINIPKGKEMSYTEDEKPTNSIVTPSLLSFLSLSSPDNNHYHGNKKKKSQKQTEKEE